MVQVLLLPRGWKRTAPTMLWGTSPSDKYLLKKSSKGSHSPGSLSATTINDINTQPHISQWSGSRECSKLALEVEPGQLISSKPWMCFFHSTSSHEICHVHASTTERRQGRKHPHWSRESGLAWACTLGSKYAQATSLTCLCFLTPFQPLYEFLGT